MKHVAEQLLSLDRPTVAMTVALPGSGKSTMVRHLTEMLTSLDPQASVATISPDAIRQEIATEQGVQSTYDRRLNMAVFERVHDRTKEVIDMGGIALIDATHCNRYRTVSASEYRDMGAATIAGLVLNVPIETTLEINERRRESGLGYVNPEDIERMAAFQQENPLTPTQTEAFDVVFELTPDQWLSV